MYQSLPKFSSHSETQTFCKYVTIFKSKKKKDKKKVMNNSSLSSQLQPPSPSQNVLNYFIELAAVTSPNPSSVPPLTLYGSFSPFS